jgi:hypothetical protein
VLANRDTPSESSTAESLREIQRVWGAHTQKITTIQDYLLEAQTLIQQSDDITPMSLEVQSKIKVIRSLLDERCMEFSARLPHRELPSLAGQNPLASIGSTVWKYAQSYVTPADPSASSHKCAYEILSFVFTLCLGSFLGPIKPRFKGGYNIWDRKESADYLGKAISINSQGSKRTWDNWTSTDTICSRDVITHWDTLLKDFLHWHRSCKEPLIKEEIFELAIKGLRNVADSYALDPTAKLEVHFLKDICVGILANRNNPMMPCNESTIQKIDFLWGKHHGSIAAIQNCLMEAKELLIEKPADVASKIQTKIDAIYSILKERCAELA